jgi:hypothetical protein
MNSNWSVFQLHNCSSSRNLFQWLVTSLYKNEYEMVMVAKIFKTYVSSEYFGPSLKKVNQSMGKLSFSFRKFSHSLWKLLFGELHFLSNEVLLFFGEINPLCSLCTWLPLGSNHVALGGKGLKLPQEQLCPRGEKA